MEKPDFTNSHEIEITRFVTLWDYSSEPPMVLSIDEDLYRTEGIEVSKDKLPAGFTIDPGNKIYAVNFSQYQPDDEYINSDIFKIINKVEKTTNPETGDIKFTRTEVGEFNAVKVYKIYSDGTNEPNQENGSWPVFGYILFKPKS